MYMTLGISFGHDLRVGGQLRSAHTHTPCGWEPRCEGMSPGLGWLTHTSDHLWHLDSGWRWDVVFFDTQGVCKYLRCFFGARREITPIYFSRRLSWTKIRSLFWKWDCTWFTPMIMLPGGAEYKASQTLKDSGLIKDSRQALGATGLRSVQWKHIYIHAY